MKYRGYSIEKAGFNFYVNDPSGHRAFSEVPASVAIAKKWIDWDIHFTSMINQVIGYCKGPASVKLVRRWIS